LISLQVVPREKGKREYGLKQRNLKHYIPITLLISSPFEAPKRAPLLVPRINFIGQNEQF
jgi:hypothetical protein